MAKGNPRSFDRDEALHRAMEFFWNHGYVASGITDLLAHMGIPRQSFYNTFGSKEQILFEAIDLYSTGLHRTLRETMDGAATPFEKIDRLFAMWEQAGTSGCFLGNCVAEFGTTHGEVAAIMEDKLQSIQREFRAIFQDAIDRGDLPAERNADVMARTMVTYSQGLALLSKTAKDAAQFHGTIEIMKQSLKV